MTKNFDNFFNSIVENTSADVFGTNEPYDTSDARTPFVIGTFDRKGKVKKKHKKRKIHSEAAKQKYTTKIGTFWFSRPFENLSEIARNVILKYVKSGTMPCNEYNCQDASGFLAKQLKEHGVESIEIHNGSYKDSGHTWLDVEGTIVDPTAAQFSDFPKMYESEYDSLEIIDYDEI